MYMGWPPCFSNEIDLLRKNNIHFIASSCSKNNFPNSTSTTFFFNRMIRNLMNGIVNSIDAEIIEPR
jgi:hypothetical protein